MRFMNHRTAEQTNVEAKMLSVWGEIRVGLFAKAPQCAGEEQFFDFGYEVPGYVERRVRVLLRTDLQDPVPSAAGEVHQ